MGEGKLVDICFKYDYNDDCIFWNLVVNCGYFSDFDRHTDKLSWQYHRWFRSSQMRKTPEHCIYKLERSLLE